MIQTLAIQLRQRRQFISQDEDDIYLPILFRQHARDDQTVATVIALAANDQRAPCFGETAQQIRGGGLSRVFHQLLESRAFIDCHLLVFAHFCGGVDFHHSLLFSLRLSNIQMQTLSIALPDFPVKSFAFFDLPQEVV